MKVENRWVVFVNGEYTRDVARKGACCFALASLFLYSCGETSQSNDAIYDISGGSGVTATGGSTNFAPVTGGSGGFAAGETSGIATGGTGIVATGGTNGSLIDAAAIFDGGQTLQVDGGGLLLTDSSTPSEGSVTDVTGDTFVSAEGSIGIDSSESGACTRDKLKASVDAFYTAFAAHDPSTVPIASTAKYTENGQVVQVGQGLWQTAGEAKFKRNVLDTQICTSVTQSVIAEGTTDIVVGLRLKHDAQEITEIEAIIVRQGDWFPNPRGIIATADDDWETVLPVDQQPTRDQLEHIVDLYFANFPAGACNFSQEPDCVRVENGTTMNCNLMMSCGGEDVRNRGMMQTRLHVLDVEASIALGYTMFMGTYIDFHMFKVRNGQVTRVHAILARASSSGWD